MEWIPLRNGLMLCRVPKGTFLPWIILLDLSVPTLFMERTSGRVIGVSLGRATIEQMLELDDLYRLCTMPYVASEQRP
jgi:hypothetical protein